MRILKTISILLIGVLFGIAGHETWQSLLNRASAVGVLKQEPETHPAISASYPAGFYVESRVYLDSASQEMLGQEVSVWGVLDLARDPDAPSYPKIKNKDLTVLK